MFCKGFVSLQSRFLAVSLVAISANEKEEITSENVGLLRDDSDGAKSSKAAAIRECTKMVRRKMTEVGSPGMVVGVSVNGTNVWTQGFGYADIENGVKCRPETVMRTASISKSMTMAAVGKLIESGKLDLDKRLQEYVPEFPEKKHKNKKMKITTKMLLTHTSGVRHYQKKEESVDDDAEKPQKPDWEMKEFYSMKPYKNVWESLEMFNDDALCHASGEKFLYTTHGFTLVSAVVEKVSGEDFVLHMKKIFRQLGMDHTLPEYATDIVYHRARHYCRDEQGRLVNVPYVDNSYKWAGGGFISNVPDLVKFGNVMLYSFQYSEKRCANLPPGFLKAATVENMWCPHVKTETKKGQISDNENYGLGWFVYPEVRDIGYGKERDFEVTHTGGAIGGSSVLYICPANCGDDSSTPPKGVVVAILTNLQSVNLTGLARMISEEFKFLPSE